MKRARELKRVILLIFAFWHLKLAFFVCLIKRRSLFQLSIYATNVLGALLACCTQAKLLSADLQCAIRYPTFRLFSRGLDGLTEQQR